MKAPTRILVVVFGLVVLLAAGGEFGARWHANQQTQERVPASVDNPQVSFPIPSLLIDAADKNLSHLRFSAEGEVPLEADITDLDIHDTANPVAGRMDATLRLSDAYLLAAIQSQQDALIHDEPLGLGGTLGLGERLSDLTRVTAYTSSAASGTSTVSFGSSTGSLEIRPSVSGGELRIDATNLTVGGIDFGSTVRDLITSVINTQLKENLQGFTIQSVTVGDGATTVTVSAENINLSQKGNLSNLASQDPVGGVTTSDSQ